MIKRIVILLLAIAAALLSGGCARQELAQQALITQMSAGLKDLRAFSDQRQQLVDSYYANQRRSLDDAFDLDFKDAPALDPAWVIEHRKAYIAAMEALFLARLASQAAHQQALTNFTTLDDALGKLRWLSELRQNFAASIENSNPIKETANVQH